MNDFSVRPRTHSLRRLSLHQARIAFPGADKHRRDLSQICQQQPSLAFSFLGRCTSKQNDRRQRRLTQREDRAEVGIRRYNHPSIAFCELKDHDVVRVRQAMVPDMSRIMPRPTQPLRDDGRKRVVDQKTS